MGTRGGGINRFNPTTRIFTRFQHDPQKDESLSDDDAELVYEDLGSNLWVATFHGLELMDRKSGNFIHYRNNQKDTNSLSSSEVTTIFSEDPNTLWVGTYYYGINRLNLKTGNIKHYLSSAYITSTYKDINGVIWVGAANGLFRYNKKTDDFLLFGEEETGFNINNVTSILGDDQDNLWLTSSLGMYRINKKRDQIKVYNEKDGVEGFTAQNNWGESTYKGKDGKIYIGSSFGYCAFYPDKLKITINRPEIDSVNFWLNGRHVTAGSGSVLKGQGSTDEEIPS